LVNDAFLIQYLAVQPQPPEGNPADLVLDEDSLTAVLQYYQDGVSRGIFPPEILDYHTTGDCWRDYVAGEAALTHVSAHRYLSERDTLVIAAPAPIPAINGPAAAINRGWALALVATEPARQSAATAFILQLVAPETNAAWNRAANYLPTRQSALAYWDIGNSYTPFIDQRLQAARPRPDVDNYTQIAAALQEAVEAVVNGAATPEEAAAQAMEKAK
jgi:ABC-type glycerol-3-phosphate transport system substrate-binding protein